MCVCVCTCVCTCVCVCARARVCVCVSQKKVRAPLVPHGLLPTPETHTYIYVITYIYLSFYDIDK